MKNRIFLVITLFVGTIVFILFSSIFLVDQFTINNLSKEQLDTQKKEKITFFNNYVNQRTRVLESIINNSEVKDFVTKGENKNSVENLFLTLAHSYQEIFQLRYINQEGMEVIRVDNYKQAKLVAQEKLQNKKGRYYFEDTMKNGTNIYYSNIDLNMERGKIEKPIVPTLRIATSIIIDNVNYGIVILNINLKTFLNDLENSSLHYISLIYDDAEIIVSPQGQLNWSRDFKLNKTVFDVYKSFPKDFAQTSSYKNEQFFFSKLEINTPNKIFMVMVTKTFNKYEQLQQEMEYRIYLLMFLTSLGIPIGYFVSVYINRLYKRKLIYEKTKTDNVLINSVINATNDLIFYKDKNFIYIGCNKAFEKFVGKSRNEIIGRSDFEIFDKKHAELFRSMDKKMLKQNSIRMNNEWVTYANGKQVYLQTKKIPFHYDNGNEAGILGISRDITELHLAQQQIKEQSLIDDLTQTLNRRAFNEHIYKKIDLFKRYRDTFCIAMYDLDDFKKINDDYGHDLGDSVLIDTTNTVKHTIRKTDLLFRVGGEEFIILFPKENIHTAYDVCEKIRRSFHDIDIFPDRKITISIGLTEIHEDDTVESIYKRVDTLLYKSKKEGKDRTSIE